MRFDVSKFKKIKSDKHTTTLKHPDGHSITLAHSKLSPQMRKEIAKIPEHKEEKFAEGGMVASASKSPSIDPKKAKDFEDSFNESGFKEARRNIKKLTGYAKGGEIMEGKDYSEESMILRKEELDKKNRQAMDKGQPQEDYPSDMKMVMEETDVTPKRKPAGYMDGGEVADSGIHDRLSNIEAILKEHYKGSKIQKFAEGGDVKPEQAPVTINIGSGQNGAPAMPEIPPLLANPNPGAKFAAAQEAAGQPQTVQAAPETGSQPYGTPAGGLPAPETDSIGMNNSSTFTALPMPPPQNTGAMPPKMEQKPAPEAGDPYGNKTSEAATTAGISQQNEGDLAAALAESKLGKEEAKIEGQDIVRKQKELQTYKSNLEDVQNHYKELNKAIEAQHIDPQSYIKKMSVGDKVLTSIGLIVSGMGSGLARQENMAAKMLQHNIDADIEAQKAELDKKETLLGANLKQYGNMRDAMDMTRMMSNEIVNAQLKQQASLTKDPIAQARLLKVIGERNQANADMAGQFAMRRTLLDNANSAPGRISNPGLFIDAFYPKEQRKEAYKELEDAQRTVKTRDNILSAFNQLEQLNSGANRITSPFQGQKQKEAIIGSVIPGLSKETAGRFTEQDAKFLENVFPAFGDSEDTLKTKRAKLNNLISERMNFPLISKVPALRNSIEGRFNAQGQSRIPEFKPVKK